MESKQRIVQFIEYKGISKRKFCEEISLSHTIFNKPGALGSNKLETISDKYPELNMDWVITGRGEMLNLNEENATTNIPNSWDNLLEMHYGVTFNWIVFGKNIQVDSEDKYLFSKKLFTLEEHKLIKRKYQIDFFELNKNLNSPLAKGGLIIAEASVDEINKVKESLLQAYSNIIKLQDELLANSNTIRELEKKISLQTSVRTKA